MVLKFQNCAPAPGGGGTNTGSSVVDGTQPVTTIDPIVVGAVNFVQKAVEVDPMANEIALHGICAEQQSGAILYWKLMDSENEVLGDGHAECDQGGFRVDLSPIRRLRCGQTYQLKAQLGLDAEDTAEIRRDCEDVAQVSN